MAGGVRSTVKRLNRAALAFALLSPGAPAWATDNDPCDATSSASDVHFTLALKDNRTVFREGEKIPLVLSFTTTAKNRYQAEMRNYDRSGRLGIEQYCVEPRVTDPLESYFRRGAIIGGGLGGIRQLDAAPFSAEAELNEWWTLKPAHYRVHAISRRVARQPGRGEQTPDARASETLRSNTIEFEVKPADPAWQAEQLRGAVQAFTGASSPDDVRGAARTLRFLNTKDSTRALARLFEGYQQTGGWDLLAGLYGSPRRDLAIEAMRAEVAVPDRAITNDFLRALVDLQVTADRAWDPPAFTAAEDAEAATVFWTRREAHTQALLLAEAGRAAEALPRKTGRARALTLTGVLLAGAGDAALTKMIHPALISAWADLPAETQADLIQNRWRLIAGPEMAPILQRMAAEAPPPARTLASMTRDSVLKHLYEVDPVAGRAAILRYVTNPKAEPGLGIVRLLSSEDLATAMPGVLERISSYKARDLDYELADRYADAGALGIVRTAYEEHAGKWACAPQSAMLRYFLRVDAAYGAQEVREALAARKDTGCYKSLFQNLGDQLPKVQQTAIDALDDPDADVAEDAALALGRQGSTDAEQALWARLRRFHDEWTGRADQLRPAFDFQSEGYRAAALEQRLTSAVATGVNWICPPDRLARIAGLTWGSANRDQIERWIAQWNNGPAQIERDFAPGDELKFNVLQYTSLSEDQLRAKLGQLPRGMRLQWRVWPAQEPGPPLTPEKAETLYRSMREVAEDRGIVLERVSEQ